MSGTPIYDAVLADTGIDPESIRNRERWSIAREDSKRAPRHGQRNRIPAD
ncbi:MAG TPA: hypothetical protein VEX40_04855 [Mycobacterium sp.]|nr:hypothetical protein [Mycobacterium sp.]